MVVKRDRDTIAERLASNPTTPLAAAALIAGTAVGAATVYAATQGADNLKDAIAAWRGRRESGGEAATPIPPADVEPPAFASTPAPVAPPAPTFQSRRSDEELFTAADMHPSILLSGNPKEVIDGIIRGRRTEVERMLANGSTAPHLTTQLDALRELYARRGISDTPAPTFIPTAPEGPRTQPPLGPPGPAPVSPPSTPSFAEQTRDFIDKADFRLIPGTRIPVPTDERVVGEGAAAFVRGAATGFDQVGEAAFVAGHNILHANDPEARAAFQSEIHGTTDTQKAILRDYRRPFRDARDASNRQVAISGTGRLSRWVRRLFS